MDHIAIHLTMECTTEYNLLRTQPLCVSYCSVDRLFSWSWLSRVIDWLFIFCFSGCVNSFGIFVCHWGKDVAATTFTDESSRAVSLNSRLKRRYWHRDKPYSELLFACWPPHPASSSWFLNDGVELNKAKQDKTRQHKTKLDDSKEIFLPSLHHCIV